MTEFLAWIASNGFVVFIAICAVYYLLKTLIVRCTRTINVALRGWPPAHLDADGDFKPEPKTDE